MRYCVNPQDEVPIFLIDCQIGRDESEPEEKYVDAEEFVRELLYMDGEGKKRIEVWINSPGGRVTGGMAIYGAILKTKTKVDTYCYGIAYSIAGVIFQAGRKRKMADYATLMYHRAYNPSGEVDKSLDAINEAINVMVSSRSWKDDDAVRVMIAKTSFISAKDACDSGLCDEVEISSEQNKPRSVNYNDELIRWQSANEIVNKILPTNNQMNKAEICKLLNLDPSVSDEFAMNALKSHLAKANDSGQASVNKTELDAAKARADKAEADAKAAKEELDALNLATAAKAKEDAEAAAKAADEAKKKTAREKILAKLSERNLVYEDKVVNNYCDMAGTSDDALNAVIETIEAIPVVKKAPNFNPQNNSKDAGTAFVVDKTGGITDTSAMVRHMNSTNLKNTLARFPGK